MNIYRQEVVQEKDNIQIVATTVYTYCNKCEAREMVGLIIQDDGKSQFVKQEHPVTGIPTEADAVKVCDDFMDAARKVTQTVGYDLYFGDDIPILIVFVDEEDETIFSKN